MAHLRFHQFTNPFSLNFSFNPPPVPDGGAALIVNALESAPVNPEAVALNVQEPAMSSVKFVVVKTPLVAAPDFVPPSVMLVQVPPLLAIVMVSVADVQALFPESSMDTETVPSATLALTLLGCAVNAR